MAPRLPQKRRSDGSGDRASKKNAKEEPTYDTFDDAFDGAFTMEEKGDRYKDGDKAQRFYEQAAELYARALTFDDKSFDAKYNLGRVWLRLASDFYLPPSNLDVYTTAMQMFNKAQSEQQDPFLKTDAAFNLAQTLNSCADVFEEYSVTDAGRTNAKELRESAVIMLQGVIGTQITYVQNQQMQKDEEEASEAAGGDVGMADESAPAQPAGDGMEVDAEDSDVKTETQTAFVQNMPTADALVDTLLLAVDIGVRLWDYYDPPALPSDEQQEAIRGFIDTARAFAPPGRQAELDLAEVKVLLAMDAIMWELVRDQVQPGQGIERGIQGAVKALEKILASLDRVPADDDRAVRADVLTTLGDTEKAAAKRLMVLASRTQDPTPLGKEAWVLLSAAAVHLGTAAKLPVTLMTPKEFRPNLYISLLDSTLARARLAPINETAKQNVQKLLDNCAAYAAKAADATGWKLPKLPRDDDPQPNPFFPSPVEVPFPSGWDMEMLARDVQLAMLRVCSFVRCGALGDAVNKDLYDSAAKAVLDGIVSVSAGPRRLMPMDIDRFVNGIEDEEGKLSADEQEWWKEVGMSIRRNLPTEGEYAAGPQASE